jgi:hypothetical protein
MCALFRSLAERIKALFVVDAGLDFEAEFLARGAARPNCRDRRTRMRRKACTKSPRSCHAVLRPSLRQLQQIGQ